MSPGFQLHSLLGDSDEEIASNLDKLIEFQQNLRNGVIMGEDDIRNIFLR